jgi:hypothetical protein
MNNLPEEENAALKNNLHKKSTIMLYAALADAIFLILGWFGSRQIIGVSLIAAIILSIFLFFAGIINFILGTRKLHGTNSDTHAFILLAILGVCMFLMSAFILLLHAAAGLAD